MTDEKLENLVTNEIADFYAGLLQPGEPETIEEQQQEITQRILMVIEHWCAERVNKRNLIAHPFTDAAQRLIAHCKLMLSEHVKFGGNTDDEDIYISYRSCIVAGSTRNRTKTNKREIIEEIFRAFNIHRRFKSCQDKQ